MERDSLRQRANTISKLTAKLQTYQGIERTNESLRSELMETKKELTDMNIEVAKVTKLELENKELQSLLPHIEQDRVELQKMKQTLEADNAVLRERYVAADNLHNRDLEIIAELEEKRGHRDSHPTSATDDLTALDNFLDSRQTNVDEMLQERVQELLHELNKLNAEHTRLELNEGDLKEKNLDMQNKLQDAYKESLALESYMTAVNEGKNEGNHVRGFETELSSFEILAHGFTRTEVFQRMREQITLAQRNKIELETRLVNLQRQTSSTKSGTGIKEQSQASEEIEKAKQVIQKAFTGQDSNIHRFHVENSLETYVTDLTKAVTDGRERVKVQSEVQKRFLLTPVEVAPVQSSRPRSLTLASPLAVHSSFSTGPISPTPSNTPSISSVSSKTRSFLSKRFSRSSNRIA